MGTCDRGGAWLLVLGISDMIDAGCAVVASGKILSAINEERIVRRKLYTGTPYRSIKEAIRIAGVDPREIDLCAYPRKTLCLCTDPEEETYEPPNRSKKMAMFFSKVGLYKWLLGRESGIRLYRSVFGLLLRPHLRKLGAYLQELGVEAPIIPVDHHISHSSGAAFTSGWDECLVVSMDASGDGYSCLVTEKRGKELRERQRIGAYHSLAVFYLYATLMLGHKAGREGKLMGLSAHGTPQATLHIFRKYSSYIEETGRIENRASGYACDYAQLKKDLEGHSPEDISAGLQRHFEECITSFVRQNVLESGLKRVALVGGVFANVRVNQCIREIPEVEDVYVFPQMCDGGGNLGCAMFVSQTLDPDAEEYPLEHIYFGPRYSQEEILRALEKSEALKYRVSDDAEAELARALAQGKLVGRFAGGMEYGPRALGNRSILYNVRDPSVNDWLNEKLGRTEYMPFAPTILEERAGEYLEDWRTEHRTAWFMTITYNASAVCRREAPAVVHIDGTTRPQILRQSCNPRYYHLLKEYERLTGLPLVLNTSFNMHEEPIVCTPSDAIEGFKRAKLDIMAMENIIVEPVRPTTPLNDE